MVSYDREKERYSFSSGKYFDANCGYVGINHDLSVSEGYDGWLSEWGKLTKDEKVELADHMIDLWEKFKDS